MKQITLLSKETIDQIAAGEVVERPASVVKELTENSIDAGANAITIEIKDGGISMIRITDNGEGIDADQIRSAFLAHATSKISDISDLETIGSLGFRGEALSSICAVSQMEVITKQPGQLLGTRYRIEGGQEISLEQIGAPEGSTFVVRNLFYNVPARKKFLKSPVTEAGYISDLVEHLALSHPEISFKFIVNGQTKLYTSGNGKLREIIYNIYGKEVAGGLIEVSLRSEELSVSGVIGKPVISRGNRNYESYYVNGRFIRSSVISQAIEEGYAHFLMQHRYPFTVLSLTVPGDKVDINVHPRKMEVRFSDSASIYQQLRDLVQANLNHRDLISETSLNTHGEDQAQAKRERKEKEEAFAKAPEPFESVRRSFLADNRSPYEPRYGYRSHSSDISAKQAEALGKVSKAADPSASYGGADGVSGQSGATAESGSFIEQSASYGGTDGLSGQSRTSAESGSFTGQSASDGESGHSIQGSSKAVSVFGNIAENSKKMNGTSAPALIEGQQMELTDDRLLSRKNVKEHRIIGQVFGTYWIVQFRDSLYIIDQHAAHEKVMYERFMKNLETKQAVSQQIYPPILISMTMAEEDLYSRYHTFFEQVGFEIEHFGGRDYQITAVPDNLYGFSDEQLFTQMLDSLSDESGKPTPSFLCEKIATMACKAAVKGNTPLTFAEADALIGELLELENPYNCPHGRPTIIALSRTQLDKRFKRIV